LLLIAVLGFIFRTGVLGKAIQHKALIPIEFRDGSVKLTGLGGGDRHREEETQQGHGKTAARAYNFQAIPPGQRQAVISA
jgi:hypothetical protein